MCEIAAKFHSLVRPVKDDQLPTIDNLHLNQDEIDSKHSSFSYQIKEQKKYTSFVGLRLFDSWTLINMITGYFHKK